MLRTVQDGVMTDIIKTRDNNTCQRCSSRYPPKHRGLHNSHYFSRGKWNTRYDEENCESLCYGCHRYMDGHKVEYEEWKIKRMGEDKFYELERRSNKRGNKKYLRSKEFTKILIKQLKELNEKRND